MVQKEAMAKEKELGFEAALEQLQATVKKLEAGELGLEEALVCFEDGVRLSRICQKQIASAEQRVKVLSKDERAQ